MATSLARGGGRHRRIVKSTKPAKVSEAAEEGLLFLLCVQGQHGLGQTHWAISIWGWVRSYCGAGGWARGWARG